MPIDVTANSVKCTRCGRSYGSYKTFFPASCAALYKGLGYIPICKSCIESMYNSYLIECGNAKDATRQMCRKLDLYWNEVLYIQTEKKNTPHTIVSKYIQKINSVACAGKSYDDTLIDDGLLWDMGRKRYSDLDEEGGEPKDDNRQRYVVAELEPVEITEDIVAFWGPGYTPEMYIELEQRLQYYRSQMGDDQNDMSTDAILRQIVMLEIDINKARAEGRAVDKMMSTFNSLMSSLNKPLLKGDSNSAIATTPLGVWIKRWEDERPLPEVDNSLKDVDGIIKYVLTWVYGHVTHMLGVRNTYSKLYEEAIEKYRVNRPEYDDEDDDTMLYDIFKDSGDGSDTPG